jgi:hypothetical protein
VLGSADHARERVLRVRRGSVFGEDAYLVGKGLTMVFAHGFDGDGLSWLRNPLEPSRPGRECRRRVRRLRWINSVNYVVATLGFVTGLGLVR